MLISIVVVAIIAAIVSTIVLLFANRGEKVRTQKRKKQFSELYRESIIRKQLDNFVQSKIKFTRKNKVERILQQAGTKLQYTDYFLISIATAIALALLSFAMFLNIGVALITFAVGFSIPKQVFLLIANTRYSQINKYVGSFLNMLTERYKLTNSMAQAIKLTTEEFIGAEPFYSELQKVTYEIDGGVPVITSFKNLALRTQNKYLSLFADYYEQASEIGTSESKEIILEEAYNQFTENKSDLSSFRKELSEPKMEAYVVLAALPGFVLYQFIFWPNYYHFITRTLLGQIGTLGVFIVIVLGLLFINKKVNAPLESGGD